MIAITLLGTSAARFDINGIVKHFAMPMTVSCEDGITVIIKCAEEVIPASYDQYTLDGDGFVSVDDAVEKLSAAFRNFKGTSGGSDGGITVETDPVFKAWLTANVGSDGKFKAGLIPTDSTLETDASPTENSNNLVTSGGVYAAIEDATSTDILPADLEGIYAKLELALANKGMNQTDIDNIITAIDDYLDQLENITVSDVSYTLSLVLSSIDSYTEDEVRDIVADAMEGYLDFATHEDVDEINERLDDHIEGDEFRWQEALDRDVAMEARIKQWVEQKILGTTMPLDYASPTTVMGSDAVLNLLSGDEWQAPSNGAIVCSAGGLLSAAYMVSVNDTVVWSSPIYALGLKIGGDESPSPEIPINAGDTVTCSGLLSLAGSPVNVTFYPNKV